MALGGPTVTLNFKGDADQLKREIKSIGVAVAGVAGTVGALGAIGAAASATVVAVAAVPAAFLGIGIAAAAQTDIVKNRFGELKDHVMNAMVPMTASIQGQLLIMADKVTAAFDRMRPMLTEIFKLSSQALAPLSDGLIALVENALPGFRTAIQNSQPLVEAFGRGLGTLGTGVGQFFAELSKGTPGAVQGFDALMKLTKDLLIYLGQLVAQLANSLGPAFAALEPSLMQVVKALGDGLLSIIQTLAPYVGTLGRDIANLLTAALDAMLPVVNALLAAARRVRLDAHGVDHADRPRAGPGARGGGQGTSRRTPAGDPRGRPGVPRHGAGDQGNCRAGRASPRRGHPHPGPAVPGTGQGLAGIDQGPTAGHSAPAGDGQ
jgi:hypothetical protein